MLACALERHSMAIQLIKNHPASSSGTPMVKSLTLDLTQIHLMDMSLMLVILLSVLRANMNRTTVSVP